MNWLKFRLHWPGLETNGFKWNLAGLDWVELDHYTAQQAKSNKTIIMRSPHSIKIQKRTQSF